MLASGAVAGSVPLGVPYDVAVRSRFFRMVTAGYVLVLGMQVGGITHLVKLGNERGGDGTGGRLIAGLTIASVVARLIGGVVADRRPLVRLKSEEHTSELQSLMSISYAVFCLKKKKQN